MDVGTMTLRGGAVSTAGDSVAGERAAGDRMALDGAAVTQVFRERYTELVGLAGLLLADRGAAEEVVQDAFAKFHLSRHRVTDPDREVAYLRSIVCNLSRGRLRRRALERRRRPVPERDEDARPDAALARHQRDVVAAALARLPRRQRECVVLRYWLDLPEREIAATLGIAPGSVKSHLHRGLAALESRLEELR
ncbi:MAG TPA: SigE family RNA polymerase sigma factor [Acidimicrobiales bacterium]|nr:SigE family RNA polymerase sigma factor [Acidimicrobiales bacterium]